MQSELDAGKNALGSERKLMGRRSMVGRTLLAALGLGILGPKALRAEPAVGIEKKVKPPADDQIADIEPLKQYIQGTTFEGKYAHTKTFTLRAIKMGRGCDIVVHLRDDTKPNMQGEELELGYSTSIRPASDLAIAEEDMGPEGKLLIISDDDRTRFLRLKDGEAKRLDNLHTGEGGLAVGKNFLATVQKDGVLLIFLIPSEDRTTFKTGDYFAKMMLKNGSQYLTVVEYTGPATALTGGRDVTLAMGPG